MSKLKARVEEFASQIDAKHEERAAIDAKLDRIERVIESGGVIDEQLAALRARRRASAAEALLEEKSPDHSLVDAEIARLEKSSAAARADADAAPIAAAQLRDQLALIDAEIEGLVSEQRQAARVWFDERHAAAEVVYAKAVDALGDALTKLAALEEIRSSDLLRIDAEHVPTPAVAQLNRLVTTAALQVPHRFSLMTDEDFWRPNGLPLFDERDWYRPRWLPTPDRGAWPSTVAEQALRNELVQLGMDPDWRPVPPPRAYIAPDMRLYAPAQVSITVDAPANHHASQGPRASNGVTITQDGKQQLTRSW